MSSPVGDGSSTLVLTHGAIPPSLNQIATRGSRWAVQKAKRDWQAVFTMLLLEAHMPQHSGGRPVAHHLSAVAYLRFPDRRERDEGNFSWLIEKTLGDALVGGYSKVGPLPGKQRPRYLRTWPEGRFLPDDNSKHFRFRGVRILDEVGPRLMRVAIRWYPWPDEAAIGSSSRS
jgi:hypothetical protein